MNPETSTPNEHRFHRLTRVAPVGIFHMDASQRLLYVNDRWRSITGLDGSEDFSEGFFHLVHFEDRARIREAWSNAIAAHHPFQEEFRILRPDGQVRWLLAAWNEERDADGHCLGFIGTLTDFTERHRAKEDRSRLEAQLLHSQKMESIDRLAGNIAHDINNMLSVILGHAELLNLKLGSNDPARVHIRDMERAAQRSKDIITQLLAFSRKQVMKPVPLDMNQQIQETRDSLMGLLREEVSLDVVSGSNLQEISFDPTHFNEILSNLVANAQDAMPRGGRITIETRNVRVDSGFRAKHLDLPHGLYVLLAVSDEGVGMSRHVQERIFEPFFTTKEKGKGTGLGLSTVFGIVKQNGGFIDVYSEVGLGSTFKLYFPALPKALEAQTDAADGISTSRNAQAGVRILVVEDDEILQNVIPMLLEELGHRVTMANSPEAALDICHNPAHQFDLLLTDVVMPGMGGKELREQIDQLRPGIKALFMSGYTPEIVAQRTGLDDRTHFIQKPFSMPDLAKKIAQALDE